MTGVQTYLDRILKTSDGHSGRLALVTSDKEISYGQLSQAVDRLCIELQRLKISAGFVVGVRFNCPFKQAVAYLSLLRLKVCQVYINPKDVHAIQERDASCLELDLVLQDRWSGRDVHQFTFNVDDDFSVSASAIGLAHEGGASRQLAETALVFLGSGTTEAPNLIAVSFDTLAIQLERDLSVIDFSAGERYLIATNLYYFTPKRRLLAVLSKTLEVHLLEGVGNIARYAAQKDVSHLALTTNQSRSLITHPSGRSKASEVLLPKVKSLLVSSELVAPSLRQDLMNHVSPHLFIGYGTNEMGEVTIATAGDVERHQGTVGVPLSGIDLKIMRTDGSICGVDELGEVVIRYRGMSSSYLAASPKAEASFTELGFSPRDVGSFKKDGNLILHGRSDDAMMFSGVKLYPHELESILDAHPAVEQAAVFPLTMNGTPNVPIACVVLQSQVSEGDLLAYCRQVNGWRSPARVISVRALPRGQSGKVSKRRLAEFAITFLSGERSRALTRK